MEKEKKKEQKKKAPSTDIYQGMKPEVWIN